MDQAECNLGTVLVVDDEESLRRITKRVLAKKGFNVLVAGSAEEALSIINSYEGSIDLLLTDICMPGMHGGDLGAEFKRIDPNSKIIYMTASAPHDIPEGIDCEMIAHKPFCIYELSDTISKMISPGS